MNFWAINPTMWDNTHYHFLWILSMWNNNHFILQQVLQLKVAHQSLLPRSTTTFGWILGSVAVFAPWIVRICQVRHQCSSNTFCKLNLSEYTNMQSAERALPYVRLPIAVRFLVKCCESFDTRLALLRVEWTSTHVKRVHSIGAPHEINWMLW